MSDEYNHSPIIDEEIYGDEASYTPDDYEGWLEAQPPERIQVAALRAMRTLNLDEQPYEYEDEFAIFGIQLRHEAGLMHLSDILAGFERRGIATSSVKKDGQILYQLAA